MSGASRHSTFKAATLLFFNAKRNQGNAPTLLSGRCDANKINCAQNSFVVGHLLCCVGIGHCAMRTTNDDQFHTIEQSITVNGFWCRRASQVNWYIRCNGTATTAAAKQHSDRRTHGNAEWNEKLRLAWKAMAIVEVISVGIYRRISRSSADC